MSETKIAVPFIASLPDSEVTAKPQRRVYAAEEKKRQSRLAVSTIA